ncbi:hypothetical protein Ddye_026850 [Dipteronia dyeriana]|uniref:AAA+ ATPase domain-containing protein n=1 Tax=Dipteronia dyeriana TaxID=168575 RepID=A0AAD9TP00_9ROSI|nr:hypothetical protein Ddye_026850 [Dipteronia dyeriana]
MEIAVGIVSSILSKIGDYLLESTVHQVGYFIYFNSIVEDLRKQDEYLRLTKERVQQNIERSTKSNENVEKVVRKWLTDVSNAIEDAQKLNEEIQRNKKCLNGWCHNWCLRYRLSKRAAKKTGIMLKLQNNGKFDRISHPATLTGIEFLAPKDFIPFESIEALNDDNTHMVGLYGMRGVGKTTLAKAVASRVKEQKIFYEVVMVLVSQTPNVKNIQGQIADLLNFGLKEESELGRGKRLYLRLKIEKKILIILDDVWDKLDLSTLGIPFGEDHMGCKILLTTRHQQVCTGMRCQQQILLNVLNENEGSDLLKRHASIGDEPSTLIDMAKDVVRECNGLPLASATIGSLLREKTVDEWKVVSQKLKKSKLVDQDNINCTDVYACLS